MQKMTTAELARIKQIKEVASTVNPYTWSNHDVLFLINIIEEQEEDRKNVEEAVTESLIFLI